MIDTIEDEIYQSLLNAKKCDLLEKDFHIEIKDNLVEFVSSQRALESTIAELIEQGEVRILKLGGSVTTIHAIYCNNINDKPTGFYSKQPIFGRCIVADIWKQIPDAKELRPKIVGEIKIVTALKYFAKLQIPDLAEKTIQVSPLY